MYDYILLIRAEAIDMTTKNNGMLGKLLVTKFVVVMAICMFMTGCGKNTTPTTNTVPSDVSDNTSVTEARDYTVDENMTLTRDGDYIIFGHYEQDGDESNGPEPIEWEIVSEENGKTLLLSRYILDRQQYNTDLADVTWEICSLRTWLNNDFMNKAFNENEQNQILTVTNINSDNVYYGTEGGNDTEDKVFCLSLEELHDNYEFEDWNEDRREGKCQALATEVTKYAGYQGVYIYDLNNCGSWLLRSPGRYSDRSANVGETGVVSSYGGEVNRPLGDGVRPAIYLSSSLIPKNG